ncbi:MAG: hypothetical protein JXA06_13585, partial [Bacteroidetes bacterium]|nr:hypothetical protein [Bacteroidota bacterium]
PQLRRLMLYPTELRGQKKIFLKNTESRKKRGILKIATAHKNSSRAIFELRGQEFQQKIKR